MVAFFRKEILVHRSCDELLSEFDILFLRFALYSNYKKLKTRILGFLE